MGVVTTSILVVGAVLLIALAVIYFGLVRRRRDSVGSPTAPFVLGGEFRKSRRRPTGHSQHRDSEARFKTPQTSRYSTIDPPTN